MGIVERMYYRNHFNSIYLRKSSNEKNCLDRILLAELRFYQIDFD